MIVIFQFSRENELIMICSQFLIYPCRWTPVCHSFASICSAKIECLSRKPISFRRFHISKFLIKKKSANINFCYEIYFYAMIFIEKLRAMNFDIFILFLNASAVETIWSFFQKCTLASIFDKQTPIAVKFRTLMGSSTKNQIILEYNHSIYNY